jgi:hypothetical protein
MDAIANTLVLKHKTFPSERWGFWSKRDYLQFRERTREQVEEFCTSIGAETVVTIAEHPLEITVWYREEADIKTGTTKAFMDEL